MEKWQMAQAAQKGLFILATNHCSNHLNMQTLLEHYKSQQAVEQGFRFLKSLDFLLYALDLLTGKFIPKSRCGK